MAAEPTPAPLPGAEEIAWAAGLFEGEGSFVPRRNGNMLITIAMADRDVLERFQAIFGGALTALNKPGGKQMWRVDIRKAEDVLQVGALMRPYLGVRRRARLDELEHALRERIAEATRPRRCSNCGTEFTPTFGSNAERQRFCDRDCMTEWWSQNGYARRVGQLELVP